MVCATVAVMMMLLRMGFIDETCVVLMIIIIMIERLLSLTLFDKLVAMQ